MGRPKSSKTVVGKIFDAANLPIYVLDKHRRIVYCNPACAAWLGMDSDEVLIGRQCDFHSESQATKSDATTSALCPPLEAFDGQEAIVRIDNGKESVPAMVIPIRDDDTGAFNVLVIARVSLDSAATNLSRQAEMHDQIRAIRRELKSRYSIERIVGISPQSNLIRRQIEAAALSRSNVVVIGPQGSGRESIARTIHYHDNHENSQRSLLPLACELLDSELLSGMMDAFEQRSSDCSDAESTLLLLDVDRLSPDAQVTLADFLEKRRQLQVLATATTAQTDLASDAFTSPRLQSCLTTITIVVPPLSTRIDDIPLLVQSAIERQNALGGQQVARVSPSALDQLVSYDWPGDVAELFETIEVAHANAGGLQIEVGDLPKRIELARDAAKHSRRELDRIELDQVLGEIEAELIVRALRQSKGNKTKAAALLGVNRAKLLRRIEQLKVDTGK